jgi:hypothetical protein
MRTTAATVTNSNIMLFPPITREQKEELIREIAYKHPLYPSHLIRQIVNERAEYIKRTTYRAMHHKLNTDTHDTVH